MSTALYRHFDQAGSLLYVGVSLSWPARTKAHAGRAKWFERVARVDLEYFPTREEALAAERSAIESEGPQFNIIYNRPGRTAESKASTRRLQTPADPLLQAISGPDAIVGPALMYRDDKISMMVAHGAPGGSSELTEVVLGDYFAEPGEWAYACASVVSIRRPNDLTMAEAREVRSGLVKKLKAALRSVDTCESDISFAVAYAATFPSERSRRILDNVANEIGGAR